MIIVPGFGPVWPIRKPLKVFGFTVVVTRTEINQRSIGNSIILNHQRFMPNNNYSFDTFAKIFEVAYFYITRSLIQDGEDVGVLRSLDSKFDWEKWKNRDWEWLWNDVRNGLWIDRLDFLSITCFCWEMNLFCRLEGEVWP